MHHGCVSVFFFSEIIMRLLKDFLGVLLLATFMVAIGQFLPVLNHAALIDIAGKCAS